MSKRLTVPKTYKLYIGGAFPRSESGRTYEVVSAKGDFLANAALASRKDARDAVTAARGAVKGWSGATAYNRGQVLYRVAEILEGRRAQFVDEIVAADRGLGRRRRRRGRRGDRPLGLVRGLVRQVRPGRRQRQPRRRARTSTSRCPSRPASSAIIAPQDTALLGLVSAVAPALVSGNSVVVVASQRYPLSAISLAEVLATSDVPGGVVNVLTGIARRARAVAGLAPRRPRARPRRRRRPRLGRPAGRRRRRRSRGCSRPSRARMPHPRASSGSPRSPRPRRSGTPRAWCS